MITLFASRKSIQPRFSGGFIASRLPIVYLSVQPTEPPPPPLTPRTPRGGFGFSSGRGSLGVRLPSVSRPRPPRPRLGSHALVFVAPWSSGRVFIAIHRPSLSGFCLSALPRVLLLLSLEHSLVSRVLPSRRPTGRVVSSPRVGASRQGGGALPLHNARGYSRSPFGRQCGCRARLLGLSPHRPRVGRGNALRFSAGGAPAHAWSWRRLRRRH